MFSYTLHVIQLPAKPSNYLPTPQRVCTVVLVYIYRAYYNVLGNLSIMQIINSIVIIFMYVPKIIPNLLSQATMIIQFCGVFCTAMGGGNFPVCIFYLNCFTALFFLDNVVHTINVSMTIVPIDNII